MTRLLLRLSQPGAMLAAMQAIILVMNWWHPGCIKF